MMRSSSQRFHDQIFCNTAIQEAQVKNYSYLLRLAAMTNQPQGKPS